MTLRQARGARSRGCFDDWNIKQPHVFSGGISAGLVKAEEERSPFRVRSSLVPIQIPQERLAAATGIGIFFRTPNGINLRVIALDAFALGQIGLENGKNLKPGVAIVFALVRVERPKVPAALILPRLG